MLTEQGLKATGKVVLIVDDDVRVLKTTSRLLVSAGYQTLEAATAEDALVKAAQLKIDILLVDAVLPGISGPELAEELLKIQCFASIIFMSGLDPLAVWMAFGKTCQVLQKPFSIDDLIRRIEMTAVVTSAV